MQLNTSHCSATALACWEGIYLSFLMHSMNIYLNFLVTQWRINCWTGTGLTPHRGLSQDACKLGCLRQSSRFPSGCSLRDPQGWGISRFHSASPSRGSSSSARRKQQKGGYIRNVKRNLFLPFLSPYLCNWKVVILEQGGWQSLVASSIAPSEDVLHGDLWPWVGTR